MTRSRAPRPYRGNKRSVDLRLAHTAEPKATKCTSDLTAPLALAGTRRDALGDRRTIDLAFDPKQPRDEDGQWVTLYHGTSTKIAREMLAHGPRAGTNLTSNPQAARQFARYASGGTAFTKDKRKQGSVLAIRVRRSETQTGEYGEGHAFVSDHRVTVADLDPNRIVQSQVDLAFDPKQPRDANGQWTIDPTNIVKRWMQATPGERTAGADWYPAAHRTAEALAKKYDVSVQEAAGLLAAYSPQTPWGRNQVEAAESLRYGHAVGGPKAALWYEQGDPNLEKRVGIMATGQTRGLAQRVMDGVDFDSASAGRNKNGSVKPKALKIRSFYSLIANGGQADPEHPRVVIDRHAMSVAYGRRVDEKTYSKMHPGSGAKYAPFVDAYKAAAAQIGAMEGRTVSPEEVQATTWLTQQRLNQEEKSGRGKTTKALGEKDWANWLQYANRYLGLDYDDGAKVGYSNLSSLGLEDVDLAFKDFWEHEPRDLRGRWTDSILTNLWIGGGAGFKGLRDARDPMMARAFENMLDRQPKVGGDQPLYRGWSGGKGFDDLKPGDEFEWNKPASTSTSMVTAERFGARSGNAAPRVFRIRSTEGRLLPGQDRLLTSREAIVPPGRYRVVGRSQVALDHSGPRMQALHPDAPTYAEVVDLEDISGDVNRPFFSRIAAEIGRHKATDIGLARKHDVSHELRGHDGRWVATPEPDDGMHTYSALTDYDDGMPVPAPGEEESLKIQTSAQKKAAKWGDGDDYDQSMAQQFWHAYQDPDYYGQCNAALRKIPPDEKFAQSARDMFKEAGVTIKKPMTVYRALRSHPSQGGKGDIDWADKLKPGTSFREDGMSSTTTYRRLAQGWLGLGGDESSEEGAIDPEDVVVEIHLPKGARIVGGNPQFIETMLPPGTTYKIVKREQIRTPNAVNPLGGQPVGKDITYTHITAEAILPEEYGGPALKADHAAEQKAIADKASAESVDDALAPVR